MTFDIIKPRAIAPALGAEIGGVDLSADLDDATLKPFDIGIGSAMDAAETLYLKAQSFFEDLTDHMQQQVGMASFLQS